MSALDAALASRFAAIALDNVVREWPSKLDHVMHGAYDLRAPHELHPAFYGSFDWHSSVHMHWLLARVRRLHSSLPECVAIGVVFDRHLDRAAIAGEVDYLRRPGSATFERTYGWAWLLKFAQELGRDVANPDARRWSTALAPLVEAFVARWLDYLPKARHPLRAGTHPNSAFGVAFAIDYARASGERQLAAACEAAARLWFLDDRDAPASYEPSGADFLSPALAEADLMRRVLSPAEFDEWLARFLPGFAHGHPTTLFTPVTPTDRADPQIVHLDGLNLSRAWCLRGIASALPAGDPRAAVARHAAEAHLAAGMEGVASADYMGSHWLASFALLALTGS
jgi:hypothetical protein